MIFRFGRPKAQRVDNVVAETRNGSVIRHGKNKMGIPPLALNGFSVQMKPAHEKRRRTYLAVDVLLHMPVEIDWQHIFGTSLLPRIAKSKPIIGLFHLY
jgi:hypothetical protein